jgi:DNA-binding NarL/FixJ family response regulator
LEENLNAWRRHGEYEPMGRSTLEGSSEVVDTRANVIRVLAVDDHPIMRESLGFLIEKQSDIRLVGEAANGTEALAKASQLRPNVILMDLQMPGMDGLETIAALRARHPETHVIVLTTYPGDARAARALELGAKAYILKAAPSSQILHAIRSAAAGRSVIDHRITQEIENHRGSEALTARETRVLELVRQGLRNSQIGEALSISEDAVKNRIRSILAKLGVGDRTEAVTVAMRRGFLKPDHPLS